MSVYQIIINWGKLRQVTKHHSTFVYVISAFLDPLWDAEYVLQVVFRYLKLFVLQAVVP